MDTAVSELEMRVAGLDEAGRLDAATAVLHRLDPAAHLEVDPATGIVHVRSMLHVLEIEDALGQAGFDVTAATG